MSPSLSSAGSVNYIYDDTGRLIKVISETCDTAVYNYDAVGNLISITRATAKQLPPVLQGINPDVVFIRNINPVTVSITLTGENLISTENIWSDNSGLVVNYFTASDTSITVNATVLSDASLGATKINVSTLYGTAGIPLNVAKLYFDPAQVTTVVGTADITARIEGLSKDYTVILNNQNPDVISAPASINIPAGSSAALTVNAVKEGTGVITTSQNAGITVYVTQPFTGEATAAAKPVSIGLQKTATINYNAIPSPSVSIGFQKTETINYNSIPSPAVSVGFQKIEAINYNSIPSPSVSVGFESNKTTNYGPVLSPPVSAIIGQ